MISTINITKAAKDPAKAQAFVDYVLSPEVQIAFATRNLYAPTVQNAPIPGDFQYRDLLVQNEQFKRLFLPDQGEDHGQQGQVAEPAQPDDEQVSRSQAPAGRAGRRHTSSQGVARSSGAPVQASTTPLSGKADDMNASQDKAIQVASVCRRYGDVMAVDDVSFEVGHGEFVSLLGPSGCGKTTTLRMIAGFIMASDGTIRVNGRDVTRSAAREARGRLRLPELCAVAAYDGRGERRLRSPSCASATGPSSPARSRNRSGSPGYPAMRTACRASSPAASSSASPWPARWRWSRSSC